MMKYEGDKRMVTMEEIEEILIYCYGDSEYDRVSGCRGGNGSWLSIENVLEEISANIY